PAPQILSMATSGSAEAMHRQKLGRLSPGASADIVVVDVDVAHTLTAYNVEPTLVYWSRAADVRYTIVGGDVIVDDGRVAGVDESAVRANFREHALALRARSH